MTREELSIEQILKEFFWSLFQSLPSNLQKDRFLSLSRSLWGIVIFIAITALPALKADASPGHAAVTESFYDLSGK